jgi:hypothetical protein
LHSIFHLHSDVFRLRSELGLDCGSDRGSPNL